VSDTEDTATSVKMAACARHLSETIINRAAENGTYLSMMEVNAAHLIASAFAILVYDKDAQYTRQAWMQIEFATKGLT
jgi:hypothetical protein